MDFKEIVFEPTIKTGDVLTVFIIIVSLFSILHELRKERFLRQKEQADKVRDAASLIISKLDRWKELSLSLFSEIETIFVETSDRFRDDHDVEKNRNFIWNKLNLARINCLENMLKENIESAYVNLYGFDPSVRPFFDKIITQLKEEEEIMFQELLAATQNEILIINYNKNEYKTSDLRNSLMSRAMYIKVIYKERLENILIFVEESLLPIISKSDENILKKKRSYFDISSINFSQSYPDIYSENDSVTIWGEIDDTN